MSQSAKTTIQCVLASMRPPFLVLTPVCIFLGVATTVFLGHPINSLYVTLITIGGLAAHISVNTFNEYFDFKSGLDLHTERTPFSGGSGALPQYPECSQAVFKAAWITFLITAAIGLFFIVTIGWALLPLGVLGLLLVFAYTNSITRYPLICLLAPGLGFGPLMVVGTVFVLTGEYSWIAVLVSLVPFFLVSNLLLLNQFPDIEADKNVGRLHYPILIGKKNSGKIFVIFLALTYLVLLVGAITGWLNIGSLLGVLTVILAIPTAIGVMRNAENNTGLIPYMKLNVVLNLLTPTLVGVGLLMVSK